MNIQKTNFLRDKTQTTIQFGNMKKDDNIYHDLFTCSFVIN